MPFSPWWQLGTSPVMGSSSRGLKLWATVYLSFLQICSGILSQQQEPNREGLWRGGLEGGDWVKKSPPDGINGLRDGGAFLISPRNRALTMAQPRLHPDLDSTVLRSVGKCLLFKSSHQTLHRSPNNWKHSFAWRIAASEAQMLFRLTSSHLSSFGFVACILVAEI